VRFRRKLANGREELYDPPSVYVNVESPNGVQTEYAYPAAVTRVSEGVYRRTQTATQEGRWWGRGRGTDGTVNAYTEDYPFDVAETRF
jgi:hypothetical protein